MSCEWNEGDYVYSAHKSIETATKRLNQAYQHKRLFKRKSPTGNIEEIELED